MFVLMALIWLLFALRAESHVVYENYLITCFGREMNIDDG